MMEGFVLVEANESEDSIIEVEVPKKPPPPVIDIEEDDDIILNIGKQTQKTLLARDIISPEPDITIIETVQTNLMKGCAISPDHWTSDMIKYYNDDWGDEEHFIVEKIQEKMDKNPSLWGMSHKDVMYMQGKIKRRSEKCWNCCQPGHVGAVCPEPPYVPKCHMCGLPGHQEQTCPNSVCLNCGNQTRMYVTCCFKCRKETQELCQRCGLLGHSFINCPDHWRLFHMTTDSCDIKTPNHHIYKSEKDRWCCNCGKRGHLQIHCRQKKDLSVFRDTTPFVSSYHKAFNSNLYRSRKNDKYKRKGRDHRSESILRINPANKTFRRERAKMRKKLNRRRKKNEKRKNQNQF